MTKKREYIFTVFLTICTEIGVEGITSQDIVSVMVVNSPAEQGLEKILLEFTSEAFKIKLYTQRIKFRGYAKYF